MTRKGGDDAAIVLVHLLDLKFAAHREQRIRQLGWCSFASEHPPRLVLVKYGLQGCYKLWLRFFLAVAIFLLWHSRLKTNRRPPLGCIVLHDHNGSGCGVGTDLCEHLAIPQLDNVHNPMHSFDKVLSLCIADD